MFLLTMRVGKGDDVEIVLVTDGLDGGIGGILGQELVGDVLNHLGSDPLASVYGAVEVDGRLGALATGTPDVDAEQLTALGRGTGVEDLRVAGERRLQVVEEGDVVRIRMVVVEPGNARDSSGTDAFIFVLATAFMFLNFARSVSAHSHKEQSPWPPQQCPCRDPRGW